MTDGHFLFHGYDMMLKSGLASIAIFLLSGLVYSPMARSQEHEEFPGQVCHHPGWPRKPVLDRPGDIDRSQNPPARYCKNDCARAGWPHAVRPHATCSTNSRYSAWFVGGGSAWIFPHDRQRTTEEGTWGLDYSLWSKPKSVWMDWTHGREQGGSGAYETDH